MKFILVRHGETTANVKRLFCGHMDVQLTEKGLAQAEEVAIRLKDRKVDKIISSDLSRAFNTASIINQYHNLEIKKEKSLREINFGDCEGYTYEELVEMKPEAFKKKNVGQWDFTFPGGENLEVLTKRVMKTLDEVRHKSNQTDTVLVVVHAGVIRSVLSMAIAQNKDAYWRFDIDNCGVVELDYYDEFCMISKLNG